MPPRINSETRAAILAFSQDGHSCQQISDLLPGLEMAASKTTVSRVIEEFTQLQEGAVKPERRLATQHLPSVRTASTIRKVKKFVDRPDPLTIQQIQRRLGISYGSVWNIINKNLQGEVRKKRKTHALSDAQVAQRVLKVPRLLDQLKGGKWRYIVSIDEAWVYTTHTNGRRKIYYKFKGKEAPENYRKWWRQKRSHRVMFVAGISTQGTIVIRFVSPNTKVNSYYYMQKVLKPLFEKDIQRLYRKDAKRVALHQDSAPAHKSLDTVHFLEDNGCSFIPEADWSANLPNLSPMDFGINAIFKHLLWKRKTRGLKGLVRAMREEWKKISKELCVRVLKSWSKRVQMVKEKNGYQIEHLL